MTDQPFSILVDRVRREVTLVFRGSWTMETFDEYERVALAGAVETAWSRGDHTCLSDLSSFQIHSQAVFARFAAMMESDPNKPRRLALVGGSGLTQMQFRRILKGDGMRLFDTVADAQRWLRESDGPSPAPAPDPRLARVG